MTYRRNLSELFIGQEIVGIDGFSQLAEEFLLSEAPGSTVRLNHDYVPETLDIYGPSGQLYTRGTHYKELAPNSYYNVSIPSGASIKVEYFVDGDSDLEFDQEDELEAINGITLAPGWTGTFESNFYYRDRGRFYVELDLSGDGTANVAEGATLATVTPGSFVGAGYKLVGMSNTGPVPLVMMGDGRIVFGSSPIVPGKFSMFVSSSFRPTRGEIANYPSFALYPSDSLYPTDGPGIYPEETLYPSDNTYPS